MEGQIHFHWNWIVVIYLFLAGVSAGAFGISALVYLIGKETHERVVRFGASIAPFPLLIGILHLICDLEMPHRFWKLFVTFQPTSVMSVGAWLLLVFSLVSFLNFYLWLPDRIEIQAALRWLPPHFAEMKLIKAFEPKSISIRRRTDHLFQWRTWTALIGIPLSVFLGIYTGVLLGALVARPFWNNPILPLLFLLSAWKTGSASILLVALLQKVLEKKKRQEIDPGKRLIHSIDLVLMAFSIIGVFLFIFGLYVSNKSSVEAVKLIMGGEFTFSFWIVVVGVGMLLPLTIEVYELIPHYLRHEEPTDRNPWISVIFATSVLIGGFALRYIVIYAGQISQTIS